MQPIELTNLEAGVLKDAMCKAIACSKEARDEITCLLTTQAIDRVIAAQQSALQKLSEALGE